MLIKAPLMNYCIKAIEPTPVEAERAFSALEYFAMKSVAVLCQNS